MFDEKVIYPTQFPVEERNRKSTDVCCTIIGAIFALTMFIVACTMWNRGISSITKITLKRLSLASTPTERVLSAKKDSLFIQATLTTLK